MVPIHEIDLKTGVILAVPGDDDEVKQQSWIMRIIHGLF